MQIVLESAYATFCQVYDMLVDSTFYAQKWLFGMKRSAKSATMSCRILKHETTR
jgi:hypothetical protein